MKIIPIINCGSLALATLVVTAVIPALGQGTLIIQHSGATDPLSEGFQNDGHGNGYPVINDMGVNAWTTPSDPTNYPYYYYGLTPQQQAESAGAGWILSADLRIATKNPYPIFSLGLQGYNGVYGLDFGCNSNGDQYVLYGSGSGDSVTLPGSNYNNYQLVYDAPSEKVSLWINGIEYANSIFTNQHETYLIDVQWGGGYEQGLQNSTANWHSVSLVITPEPSTVALVFFGSSVLLFVRKRK